MWNGPSLWERRARNEESVILKKKQPESYNANNNKRKTRQVKTAKVTAGRGCSESKWLAAKSATSWSFLRVLRPLTRLSRSFFSMRFSDTREGSPKPEKVHNLERRCYRG
jgi:hypothetical protein